MVQETKLREKKWTWNPERRLYEFTYTSGEQFAPEPVPSEVFAPISRVPEPIPTEPEPVAKAFEIPDVVKTSMRNLYPDAFTKEESPQAVFDTIKSLAFNDPDSFIQDIKTAGRNQNTETLLKALQVPEPVISEIFAPGIEEQKLFKDALPLIVKETTASKMTDYLLKDRDALRRSLITAGRNQKTETLVKYLYPEITDREFKDYFNPRVPGMALLGELPSRDWLDRVKEVGKDPLSLVPYVASGKEIITLAQLMKTALDLEQDKEVSKEDLLALKAYVDKSTRDTTWGYEVVDVLAQLAPFAGELITTGGIFSAGKAATVKAGESALKSFATRTGLRILEGKLAKYGLEVAGTLVGGTLQTVPAGITRIPAATLEKQLQAALTGDEQSVWESAAKSLGEAWIETVSERSGGLFTPLTNRAKGQLVKLGLFKVFQGVNPGKSANKLQRIMKRMGYNSVLEEMLEERIGDVGHGILYELGLSDQEFKLPSARQLSVELASFAIPGVAAKVLQTTPGIYEKLKPEVKEALSAAVEEAKTRPERGSFEIPGEKPEEITSPVTPAQTGPAAEAEPPVPEKPTTEPSAGVTPSEIPAAIPGTPEVKEPVQEWFHGSKQEIDKFALSYEAPGRNVENLFGEGLYVTDNPVIAGTYAKTGGTTYKLTLKPNLKLLDLENPLPQDATEAFINFVKYNDQFLGSIDEQTVIRWIKEGKSGAEIYNGIVDDIFDMPKSEAIEAFGGIVQSLQDKGYEGFSHLGGKYAGKGKTLHNVRILWNPEDAITSRSITPAAIPKAEAGMPESVPKKAANIRLEKYSEEVRPFITEWTETHPTEVQEARRGVISDEKVRTEAERLTQEVGGDLDKMRKRWKPGTAWNAEELVAIRSILQEKTKAVIKSQEEARKNNSTENLLKLQIALQEQSAVQEQVHGLTAEAGRALRSFRQNALDAIKSGDTARMEEILKQIGGRENTEKLAQLLSQIDINDPIAVNKFIQNLYKPTFMDYLTELFYNSILSGPKTHIVNSLSNTANMLFSPVERAVSALVDLPLAKIQGRPQARFLDEVPADIFGAIRGIPEGFRQFAYIIKNGISFDQATKWEFRPKAFKGKLGAVIGMPSRFLEAADALMKSINQRAAINAEAHRLAKMEGLKAQAFEDRVSELLSNPTAEMLKEANKVAEYRLFRQEPGKFGKTLMNLREAVDIKGFKPLRFVIPFIRTPMNLVKYGLERTPLGFLNPKLWENVAQKNPEAADQIARAMIGSIGLASLSLYAAAGMITGAPPRDRAERERFYREGKQPFAIRVGGFWVSYQRLEPFNQLLGLVAIIGDGIRSNEKGIDEKITDAVNTFGQNFISQTYMQGFSDLINMLAEPERYAGNWLNRFASSLLIPMSSATRTAAQMMDNTVKDPANAWEVIESNIPGLSRNVKAKLTALGEDIERKSPAWFPVNITPVEETLLSQELERLKYDIGFVGKTISGIDLTENEQYEYQKLSGELIKQDLEKLMLAPDYWTATDGDRTKMVGKVVDTARDWAKMKMREKVWTVGATEERLGVLQTALTEIDTQLGKVISATPDFTHEEPNVYDLSVEMDNSYKSLLGDIPAEVLKGIKLPETAKSWYEKNKIAKETSAMPDKSLISLSAKEGTTFEDYYTQWQQRSKITDERELTEFDNKYPNTNLGNMSKRQIEILREYHKTTVAKQAEFLAKLPEDDRNSILNNSYKDWIESHPKENAELAVWGEAKLLTKESYEEFNKLVKQLDVPDSALPKGIIPENLGVFMVETEKAYRDVARKFEATQYLDDTVKDENGLTDRERARKELRATKVGDETFRDVERRVEAMGKGTREIPISDELVTGYVGHMKKVDETSGSSAEAKLDRYDNPILNDFLMNEEYWGESKAEPLDEDKEYLDNYLVPRWRIDVKYRKEDAEYQAILDRNDSDENSPEAKAYMAEHEDYREDERRRQALGMTNKLTDERFPLDQVETFVEYNEQPIKGFWRDRMFYDAEGNITPFAETMRVMGNNGKGIDIRPFNEIPDIRYDQISLEYLDLFEELDSYSDITSPDFKDGSIKDKNGLTERERATASLLARNPSFQQARWEQDAYLLFIGKEKYVPEYVGYQVILDKGKPTGAKYWFDDDWYIIDHPEFWTAMKAEKRKANPDWGKDAEKEARRAPPKDLFNAILKYDAAIGVDVSTAALKKQLRRDNPRLDAWLVLVGAVSKPIEQIDKEAGLTSGEKADMKLTEKRLTMDKLDQEIQEKLRAFK